MSIEVQIAELRHTMIALQARAEVTEQTIMAQRTELCELRSALDKASRSIEYEREQSRKAWGEIVDLIIRKLDVYTSDVAKNIEAAASRSAAENTAKARNLLSSV